MITRTWYDPCPVCGREVTGFDIDPVYVVDNPSAVLSVPDPGCPVTAGDPDADCTCTVFVNPAPDPWQDVHIMVGAWVTMRPCGDRINVPTVPGSGDRRRGLGGLMAGWRIYQQIVPEPGSLGELMTMWAQDPPE